jgi:succinoglycan biosynthesis transport protein ExoP
VQEQLASTPEQTVSQVRASKNEFLMQQLKTTLLDLQLKRTALLESFKPDYRPVQEVQKQIDQTIATITKAENSQDQEETKGRNPSYEWLQSELTKSNAELASLHARTDETLSVIRQYRAQLGMIDVNGAAQQNLLREVKEAEGNDLLYKQKREEARIGDALDRQRIVNVAIAEAATVPAFPTHSHWALTLLFGILLASFVSSGVAFGLDYFDPSLRTPDELRDVLQIPVLAALPKEKGKRDVS